MNQCLPFLQNEPNFASRGRLACLIREGAGVVAHAVSLGSSPRDGTLPTQIRRKFIVL